METPTKPSGRKPRVRIRLEKRPRGKVVTVIDDLDPARDDLSALAARLKSACGAGGTLKVEPGDSRKQAATTSHRIELQGNHLDRVDSELVGQGYRTTR